MVLTRILQPKIFNRPWPILHCITPHSPTPLSTLHMLQQVLVFVHLAYFITQGSILDTWWYSTTQTDDMSKLQQISDQNFRLPFGSSGKCQIRKLLICACNASLSFQEYPYLLKNSHQADTVDTFSLAGLSPARASSKSVKYFTTMTCLACFLDAIVSWTKSMFEKGAKSRAAHCVQGKSWIEAWNPNPTFSRWGQKLFQSIFLLTKLEIEAFCHK